MQMKLIRWYLTTSSITIGKMIQYFLEGLATFSVS